MATIKQVIDSILVDIKKELTPDSKLAILGIGNLYREDDAAGLHVVRQIQGKISDKILTIEAADAPENHLFELLDWKPTHLLAIDAADMKLVPGSIGLIKTSQIMSFATSSHSNSKLTLFNLLKSQNPQLKIYIIGIQAKTISYEEGISDEIKTSINFLAEGLNRHFSSL
ncbi:MAG: hydrogenase maturation protease [Candidatus Helarchaeota archaeon]